MSDTQHDEAVHVTDAEAQADLERREARELAYQEVSLRAVELLASAQRAADEAVAEAQSYARDLEETAREQYRHILQRAHDAARAGSGTDAEASAAQSTSDSGNGLDGRELDYVRTYARVAHTQLKAVLGALNDELDRLADLADGSAPTAADAGGASSPEEDAGRDARFDEQRHDEPAGGDEGRGHHDGHDQG